VSFAAFGSILDFSWKYYNTSKIKYKSVDIYKRIVDNHKQMDKPSNNNQRGTT